jgi:hypothetical protein
VRARSGSRPPARSPARFDDIDNAIARDALAAIPERYKQLSSGDVQSVNR